MQAGVFTTTPSQHIALRPGVPPTWQNYTALLFMQLARDAFTRSQREQKQEHPGLRWFSILVGDAPLSTGQGLEPHSPPPPEFQPLEESLAWDKLRKIEKDRATQARQLAKRLRAGDQPASLDSSLFSLDKELVP